MPATEVSPGTIQRSATVAAMQAQLTKLDAAIEYLRDQVVPAIKPLSGFQTAVVLTNRENGFLMAASVWATEADRQASAAVMPAWLVLPRSM